MDSMRESPKEELSMYVPDVFREHDPRTLLALAEEYPFATILTVGDGGVAVSHLPLLVDAPRNVLRGHLALENPQSAHFAGGAPALAIFHGPHGYVSPSVYLEPGVPTWNYVVVHAHGSTRIVDESSLLALLDDMVNRFERGGWRMQTEPSVRQKLGSIVGFEIAIERLEG
jgi:transcriptional regulator